MKKLGIDIETFSDEDLETAGVYRYVASDAFTVLMMSFRIDDDEDVLLIDFTREQFPQWLKDAILDPNVVKSAWNANFEITCLSKYLGVKLDVSQWECTMVKASMLGYPMSLEACAKALKLETLKDRQGKALIKLFTMPDKNGKRVMPEDYPAKWNAFCKYCIQDTVVEQNIKSHFDFMKFPSTERKLWVLDRKINDLGVMLNVQLVDQAVALKDLLFKRLMQEAIEISGLQNPNSLPQIKKWLSEQLDTPITSATKESLIGLLEQELPDNVRRFIEIRQELAKTSNEKYVSMQASVGKDKRVRGLLQIYGAGKTGRWAGRLIQVQNLTWTKISGIEKPTIEDFRNAHDTMAMIDVDVMELMYGNVSNQMSSLIRTMFVAPPGKEFLISDFSAIEARITAWFADETWRLEVFRSHGKIYEASASQMFKIPLIEVTKDIRSKGKVAELALGFQGGKNALIKMGALKMGLNENELQPIVNLWRKASPKIVKFWYDVEEAAIEAIANPGSIISIPHLKFLVRNQMLFIQLPSGRFLSYVKPHLKPSKFSADKKSIGYWGIDQKTKQWSHQETYGGKLVENIVQGTARDILADSMLRLDAVGLDIVMHVHDEVVMETWLAHNRLEEVNEIMATPIKWLPGLPLKAESFTAPFYMK